MFPIQQRETMFRRNQSFVLVVALFLTCAVIWFLQPNYGTASTSFSSLDSQAEKGEGRKWPRRVTPQAPLGVTPKVALTHSSPELRDIQNSTLGFQKIFILSMPNRSDKRDALALSAYLTGLDVEFIDGVNGSLVSSRAYPANWKMNEPPGTIGCWRGHMEIYQKMVRERIHSAMIMEDDVDWDVMIKAQMTEFARGTRHLQKTTGQAHSPYGDGWDILSMGHCGLWNKVGEDQEYWTTKDDPTVVIPSQRQWWRKPNLSPEPLSGNYTRLVFSPYKLACLASYAVSLPGAARILYDQAIQPNAQGIDSGLSAMCKRQEYGFNSCLGAYPMITGVHRPAGDMTKESDRRKIEPGRIRKFAQSDNLVFPVRLNLGSLLRGITVVKAQFPEFALVKEIDTATFQLPRGVPAFIKRTDFLEDPTPPEEVEVIESEETAVGTEEENKVGEAV